MSRRDIILSELAALQEELESLPPEEVLAEDVEGIRSDLEEITKRLSNLESQTKISRDSIHDHYSRLERLTERMNRLEQAIYGLQMLTVPRVGSTPTETPE